MTGNITNDNNIGFTLDKSVKEVKKYDVGQIAFVDNDQEKGIYIGLGTENSDNEAIKIFSSKDVVDNAANADKAKSLDTANTQIGGPTNPVYFSSTGFPVSIDFSVSSTQVNIHPETTLISQQAVTEIIDTKISNLPAALHFKGIVSSLPNLPNDSYEEGDVILLGTKEYVLVKDNEELSWYEFGDETRYVTKDFSIHGIENNPVTVAGNFEGSEITITHNPISNLVPATAPNGISTFGNSSTIPQISVNQWGHITAVHEIEIENPLSGFSIATLEKAQNENAKTTLLTQNLITDEITNVSSTIYSDLYAATSLLQSNINNIGSLKFIGNFDVVPNILKDESGYYIEDNGEKIYIYNGNLITVGSGQQYIARIVEPTNGNQEIKEWKVWGNSSNYVQKGAVTITATDGLIGGGLIENTEIFIKHPEKEDLSISTGATTTGLIGNANNLLQLNVDKYGHIIDISTVPSKLSGYTISNVAVATENSTTTIVTQSGIESIVDNQLDEWKNNFSNPLQYKGIYNTLPDTNCSTGDIVLVPVENQTSNGHRYVEYIYTGSVWESIGEENLYAFRDTQVIGTGILVGGGPLTGTVEISHKKTSLATGIYGGTNTIPVLTIDEYGHITHVSTSEISFGYSGPTWTVVRNYTETNTGN